MGAQAGEAPQWLIWIIGLPSLAGMLFLVFYAQYRRMTALKRFAQARNLHFRETGTTKVFLPAEFLLTSQSKSGREIHNWIHGQISGVDVSIADWHFIRKHAHKSRMYRYPQTVLCFSARGMDLPYFTLRPESVVRKLGTLLGGQDIDFPPHPAFSRLYLLRGKDEEPLRAVFGSAVLSFFERHPHRIAEGKGDTLVYYQPRKIIRPKQLGAFLEEGLELLELLSPGGPPEHT